MAKRALFIAASTGAIFASMAALVPSGAAQRDVGILEPAEARAQLERATRAGEEAEARASELAQAAQQASEAADKAAREAAAIAAEIQGAEADIEAARARYSLAQTDRAALSIKLSKRREPLVRLTGALQASARRPLALSALQPGSLKDVVYVRAVLNSAVPQIRQRTAALRSELEEGRRLERRAMRALENLRRNEEQLQVKRQELAQLETRERLTSREARSNATRESDRALALAEEARDLDGLMGVLDEAASLRRELAALPGPIMRPAGLGEGVSNPAAGAASQSQPVPAASPTTAATPPDDFRLPVAGRTIAGFGTRSDGGLPSKGLQLAPTPGAQIVAPATGRVAFAGPYRGYGRIVIIEHPGGWTSLVTGMARINVEVGDELIGGSPVGTASGENPVVNLELRRDGTPVNPIQYL